MSRFRILFLGTPDFAAEALERMSQDSHFDVVAVVSQPDRPAGRKMQLKASEVKELALAKGIPVFTPETVNTEEFRNEILKLKVESAVVVAFGQILGQKFLDLFPHGCVNVHGSLLPNWRGAAPIQRSIMAGDTESGVALQVIVKKLDAGPVLGSRKIAVPGDMNSVELYDKLKVLGAELLRHEYADYLRGFLTPTAQDESQVSFAAKIDKAEAKIDWSKPAREIHNKVRGLAMGPAAMTMFRGQSLKIHKTAIAGTSKSSNAPGSLLSSDNLSLVVTCGEGSLQVLEVQPESRSRMPVAEFLRGYPLKSTQGFPERFE